MNLILLLIVFPLATIIFSIALERLLNSPILVSAIIFISFVLIAYLAFGTDFIIAAVVYAFIALITAIIVSIIPGIICRINCINNKCCCNNRNRSNV